MRVINCLRYKIYFFFSFCMQFCSFYCHVAITYPIASDLNAVVNRPKKIKLQQKKINKASMHRIMKCLN